MLKNEDYKAILDGYNVRTVEDAHSAVKDLMKGLLEKALEGELDQHLGYAKHDQKNKDTQDARNGSYSKHVNSSLGSFEIDVPRDRDGDHEPIIIQKGQSDISNLESRIISMSAMGATTRQISEHMREIYGTQLSAETISKITDRIIPEIKAWQSRQLQDIYAIVYMDAIHFNVRDNGRTIKKAVYLAMGIDCYGMKDVLGIWIGGNESSKYWLGVLTDIKNRGVHDILITAVDGLPGFQEAIEAVFPMAEIQRCIVHQIRNSCKFVNYKDRKEFCADMKTIYGAPTEEAGLQALVEFNEKWGEKYGYAVKSWEANWANLSTFFKYPDEIRRLIYTTNPIESLNSSIRKVCSQKRIFPTDDSVLKSVYFAVQKRIEKWSSRTPQWSSIFSQLAIHFEDRLEVVING